MSSIPLTQGRVVLVDDEDYEWLSERKWHAHKSSTHWYAACWIKGKMIRMHRLITDAPDGLVVDHINGDTLDNRRCNLRICTTRENNIYSLNKKFPLLAGGVRRDSSLWHAFFTVRSFETHEEAAAFYEEGMRVLDAWLDTKRK